MAANPVCVFPDGSICDEWAYFRGDCSSGAHASSTPAIAVEATTEVGGGPGGSSDTGEDGSGGTSTNRGAPRQWQDRSSLWYII